MPDQLWTSAIQQVLQLIKFVGGNPIGKVLLEISNRDFVNTLKLLAKEKEFSVV